MPVPKVREVRWEDGTGLGGTPNSPNNVNVVSSDAVKTVCRKIDKNKNIKRRHVQMNQTLKILVLFIK